MQYRFELHHFSDEISSEVYSTLFPLCLSIRRKRSGNAERQGHWTYKILGTVHLPREGRFWSDGILLLSLALAWIVC